MSKYKIGSCVHLVIDYVCTCGKHQNYPCPYREDFSKCNNFVPFTQKMLDDVKTKGYFTYEPKEI